MGAPFYFFTSGSVLIWLRHSSRHLAWVAYTSCMIPEVLAFIDRSMLLIAFVIASTFNAFISFGFSSIFCRLHYASLRVCLLLHR